MPSIGKDEKQLTSIGETVPFEMELYRCLSMVYVPVMIYAGSLTTGNTPVQ